MNDQKSVNMKIKFFYVDGETERRVNDFIKGKYLKTMFAIKNGDSYIVVVYGEYEN